jgi:hypothetical protein
VADRLFQFALAEDGRMMLVRHAYGGNYEHMLQAPGQGPDLPVLLLADLLALLPVETARPAVRAYLARDPEAAAKVAGPWEDVAGAEGGERVRVTVGCRERSRWTPCVVWRDQKGWHGVAIGHYVGPFSTIAEAKTTVDALLTADGWVLGVSDVG